MSLIQKLTPTNLNEEKQKFFKANFKYEPQFTYLEPIDPKLLAKYGKPTEPLSKLAEKILNQAFKNHTYQELVEMEGEVISSSQTYNLIQKFLKMHQLENRFQIIADPNISSRATATSNSIKLQPNTKFRKEGILSMLYHEIGTHVLRRINYEKQPWYKKKKQYGLTHNYLKTEEGLAVIHGHLPRTNKLMWRSALKYLGVAKAYQLSFSQLFAWISQYRHRPEANWRFCVRLKRGLTDTSQPGGFTKDLVYFAGFVKVWHWLSEHNFMIDDLYYGKLALEDVEIAKKLNPNYQPVLPSFYLADRKAYKKNLKEIGRVNFLEP